mgnify:CR=1 FL=1|jgi:hypothetical protein|tara:strand:- start:898 stop:1041 length:144 start_codon:yes stop_codon:yes gene_type:complete
MNVIREIKNERKELRNLKKIKPDVDNQKRQKRNNLSTGPLNPFTFET